MLLFFSKPILFLYCKLFIFIKGLFSSTHKTLALGIPLINDMFVGRSDIGLLSIPLLMYHPVSLTLGSLLSPYLKQYILENTKQLLPTADSYPTVAVPSSSEVVFNLHL